MLKKESSLKDTVSLLEKEITTVADKAEKLQASLKEIENLKSEIKALKIFLGRLYPDFKKEFPEILKKL